MKGDVVVLNFPFSDLSQTKRRPALILAVLQGDDLILCQITSQAREDGYSIRLRPICSSWGRHSISTLPLAGTYTT